MTGKTPPELIKYAGQSEVATHGLDVVLFFHYSDSDSRLLTATKARFRRLIRDFMVTGSIPSWKTLPAVYDVAALEDVETDRWTEQYCSAWRSFYPMYSWMN